MVKQAGVVAWLGGIAALIGLATWSSLGAVGQAVSSVGWGILLVVLARAVALAVAGVGWWLRSPRRCVRSFAHAFCCGSFARRPTSYCRWRKSAAISSARAC